MYFKEGGNVKFLYESSNKWITIKEISTQFYTVIVSMCVYFGLNKRTFPSFVLLHIQNFWLTGQDQLVFEPKDTGPRT